MANQAAHCSIVANSSVTAPCFVAMVAMVAITATSSVKADATSTFVPFVSNIPIVQVGYPVSPRVIQAPRPVQRTGPTTQVNVKR